MKKIVLFLLCTLSCWVYSQQILSLRDPYTQELVDFSEVKTFSDGKPMTDAQCDGVIYKKEKGKYYKRVFQGAVNVKWFGAKGDGNADDVGTDDTQAILKAFNILSKIYSRDALSGGLVAGGFRIFFPSGKYLVNQAIKLPNGISIEGESITSTIIHAKNPTFIFTNLVGFASNKIDQLTTSDISIENLTLQQGGIELQNAINSRIKNLRIINLFGKETDTGLLIKQSVNLKLDNIKIFGSSGIGIIYEDSAGSGPSTTTTFDNIWISHCHVGMLIDGKSGGSHSILTSKIYNSIFEYNNVGIIFQGNVNSFVLRDSHFEQNKDGDIKIGGTFKGTFENLWTDIGNFVLMPDLSRNSEIYLYNINLPLINKSKNKNVIVNCEDINR